MSPTKISAFVFVTITIASAAPLQAQDPRSSAPAPKTQQVAPATKGMQGMGNKAGSGMSGGDMQKTMAQCAAMREQMKQGKPMSADMQAMMQKCDQMDKEMPMPDATKSR